MNNRIDYVPNGYNAVLLDETTSTNDVAKELALQNAPEKTIVISERQTGGRGRHGKTFFSPDGTGLYMSIILRPEGKAADAVCLTSMTAVCVSKAIEKCFGIKNGIKWVNDIYVDGKKVCGILTEGGFSGGKLEWAVVGIGVNMNCPREGFPTEIQSTAGYLFSDEADRREELVKELLCELEYYYSELDKKLFFDEYRDRMILYGKKVDVIKADLTEEATVIGLDDNLSLIVRYGDGRKESLYSGDVSIKKIF